jgi:hypoxanthine phosphoribosyltransferase
VHGQQISGVDVLVVDDEADTREATVLLFSSTEPT